jgi:hypothetical protein
MSRELDNNESGNGRKGRSLLSTGMVSRRILCWILDKLFLTLVFFIGLVVLVSAFLWFLNAGKESGAIFNVAQMSFLMATMAFVGAVLKTHVGGGNQTRPLGWVALLSILSGLGFLSVGLVLPVGQSYETSDPEYPVLALILGVGFYGGVVTLSTAIGLFLIVVRRLISTSINKPLH